MVTTRATRRLTKTAIDSLKPKAEPYAVYDSEVTGLSIRIAPSGVKTWRVEYRVAPGGRGSGRRMSLGPSTTITAEQARREALAIRADAARGHDPATRRPRAARNSRSPP